MERKNNFDFLRLLFASTVIFSHSFPLTNNQEIIAVLTKDQIGLGGLSVEIFFIISGYLILNSLKFSKTPLNFLWKRLLRLYPALIVMLLFSLVVIFFVYQGENIFQERDYKSYLPNNLKLYTVQYNIPGVFENNLYPNTINGSLWSLCYEFTMYIFILLLFPFKNNKKVLLSILTIFFLFTTFVNYFNPNLFIDFFHKIKLESYLIYKLAAYFIAGSILSQVDLNKYNTLAIKLSLFTLLFVSVIFNFYYAICLFVLPILVLLIGISFSKILHYIPNKIGDISYGVYIYGFLIQQTLMNYFNLNPYLLFFYSLIITYIISYLSWNLIEKKCLKFKKIFSNTSFRFKKLSNGTN